MLRQVIDKHDDFAILFTLRVVKREEFVSLSSRIVCLLTSSLHRSTSSRFDELGDRYRAKERRIDVALYIRRARLLAHLRTLAGSKKM